MYPLPANTGHASGNETLCSGEEGPYLRLCFLSRRGGCRIRGFGCAQAGPPGRASSQCPGLPPLGSRVTLMNTTTAWAFFRSVPVLAGDVEAPAEFAPRSGASLGAGGGHTIIGRPRGGAISGRSPPCMVRERGSAKKWGCKGRHRGPLARWAARPVARHRRPRCVSLVEDRSPNPKVKPASFTVARRSCVS